MEAAALLCANRLWGEVHFNTVLQEKNMDLEYRLFLEGVILSLEAGTLWAQLESAVTTVMHLAPC